MNSKWKEKDINIKIRYRGYIGEKMQKYLMKRQSFVLFDTNVTGKKDSKKLRAAIQSLKFYIKNPTIYKLIAD